MPKSLRLLAHCISSLGPGELVVASLQGHLKTSSLVLLVSEHSYPASSTTVCGSSYYLPSTG